MTNRHTFQATYRGFPVELLIEADGSHPGGVRLTASFFGCTHAIVVQPDDARDIGAAIYDAGSEGQNGN